jgi:arylsulfatase A-like enzyme
MSLRALFRILVALGLCSTSSLLAAQPNIIFILCDDLGYGDLGVLYQNSRASRLPRFTTPNLDRFATEGVQLRDYYCPAPVCAPSRASLLLGVHQGHANVRDNQFDKALEDNHTLATVLRRAGYATVALGKWGLQGKGTNPAEWPAYPTKRGFDEFFGYVRHSDGHEHYPKEGLYRKPKQVWATDHEISSQLDKCYTADLFTARAKKWIVDHQAAHTNQPFFMYLAYDTPHVVLELPTQAYPAGGGTNGGLQWLGTPGHMINTASGTIDSYCHPDYVNATWDDDKNPTTPEVAWPEVYKRYATAVRRIDDCVGDLMVLLSQLQLATNTLVVFTSDNGPEKESFLPQPYAPDFFGSFGPFDGIKRDTWEGGIRVGALVRWPAQIHAGQTSTLPCSASDWLATFAEVAGLPAPARSDGVSLVPTLTGQGKQRTPIVYVEYFHNGKTPDYSAFTPAHRGRKRQQMQMLRLGNFVGVRYDVTSATNDFELYDIVADPQETNNLALQPAFASLEQQLKARALQVRRPNTSAPRPYDLAPVPASANSPSASGRLEFGVFQGHWPWVPDFGALAPLRRGQVADLDLSVRPCDENFGIAFSGFITVPAEGDYTFYLKSDSGALLRIHDAAVIDDDFRHTGTEASASIRLQAGRHPFRLYYRHGSGPRRLSLDYSGPNLSRQPVPRGAFSS